MNVNFERHDGQLTLAVEDSFIEALKVAGGDKRIYEKRLVLLFRELLAPTPIRLTVNQAIQGQSAANCGIHAVINKLNHEHGLQLDPRLLVVKLRQGIDASYDSDLSMLIRSIHVVERPSRPPAKDVKPLTRQELLEQCEVIYTSAIDTIWNSGEEGHIKMAAIRNLFLADNNKPGQPVSSFRPIVAEFLGVIETAQRCLLVLEQNGPRIFPYSNVYF